MWGSAPGQEEGAMASVALRPKPLGPLPPSITSVYLPVLLLHKEARAVGAGPARRGDARPRKKLARRHVHHNTPSALSHFTSSRRSVAPLCNFADLLFSCGLRFPFVAASTPFLSDRPQNSRAEMLGELTRVPQKYPRQEGGLDRARRSRWSRRRKERARAGMAAWFPEPNRRMVSTASRPRTSARRSTSTSSSRTRSPCRV